VKRQEIQVDKMKIRIHATQWSHLPNLVGEGNFKFDFGRSLNREKHPK
jgi:hypothetical protein